MSADLVAEADSFLASPTFTPPDDIERACDLIRALAVRLRKTEQERDEALGALWTCYEMSGADTDGDSKFHCNLSQACRSTVNAVLSLRQGHDAVGEELAAALAVSRTPREALERIANPRPLTGHTVADLLMPFEIARAALDSVRSGQAASSAGDPTDGLPPDLARVLRDQSVIVPQDQSVFELIATGDRAITELREVVAGTRTLRPDPGREWLRSIVLLHDHLRDTLLTVDSMLGAGASPGTLHSIIEEALAVEAPDREGAGK